MLKKIIICILSTVLWDIESMKEFFQMASCQCPCKHLQCLRLTGGGMDSPWGWSQRWGPSVCPETLGLPPAERLCHEVWPHTQRPSSSRTDLHPSSTSSGAHTGTLWSYPHGCIPWCALPKHGSGGWGLHSPDEEEARAESNQTGRNHRLALGANSSHKHGNSTDIKL